MAALEAAAIYAVITGLMVSFVPREKTGPLQANEFKLTPPPPPPKEPPKQHKALTADQQPRIVAVPHQEIFKPGPITPIELGPVDPPSPGPAELVPIPRPSPPPGLTPRLARPLGSTARWATNDDYPGSELRQGNQGLVRFSLTVGADGRVSACVVTKSSGFAGLDEATCNKVSQRARFEPATDASGAKVTGSYAGSVRWVIPE